MAIGSSRVIQVTNIAPQATKDQMQTLFGYLGKIDDIRLYPTIRDVSCPVQSRICYIKFVDATTVGVAQHMTNTVFIDRALIVIPISSGEIPDEYFALEMTRNGTIVPGLHLSEPNLPPNIVNSVVNLATGPAIVTYDPKLEASGLSPYPPLPSNYDTGKIEEIRRTVVLADIDPALPPETFIDFFAPAGEVKYMRLCTRYSDNQSYMLVEFSDQPCIKEVLKLNGQEFNGTPAKIIHSIQSIVKPQAKSNEAAQREIEEAMSRVKEAQNLISATIDPVIGMLSKDKRRRSRSRSRGRHRRSRSRSTSRRRSRTPRRSRRSRSKSRKRSRSRDRKRHSKSPRRRSRSRSRSKVRKSRSKSRSKSSRRDRSRYKSKERARSRDKSKEKDKSRSSRDKDDKENKSSRTSKDRDRSRERSRGKSRAKSKDRERPTRDSKERRVEKESTTETEEKRSSKKSSRSPSRTKYRSRSRERKRSRSRSRRRSRSRGRRRSPSPRRKRRSRTRSKDRKRDKHDKRDKRERTPSIPKRNYDEEEKGYDDKNRRKDFSDSYDTDNQRDKDSDAKSDNMDISNSP